MQTQVIANASVDRNDSLLAQLLNLLINYSWSPPHYPLNWTEDPDPVIYQRTWSITVTANDVEGKIIQSPDSYCLINTTQTTTPTYMEAEGNHFIYSEHIYILDDFFWTTNCFWT
jgi:hypothetical protein